jgi:hypothetical protein
MLKFRVNFVYDFIPKLRGMSTVELERLSEDDIRLIAVSADSCCIFLTWHRLRQAGLDVSLSDAPRIDSINIMTAINKSVSIWPANLFKVVCRADGPDSWLANFVIDQNSLRRSSTGAWIHHWPQPGLISRSLHRGDKIESAVFKGFSASLDREIINENVISRITGLGINFKIDDFDENNVCIWHDYSNSDIVVAIRNLTKYSINNKPASKLYNAWRAGVPAILGPEPAYQALRRSELDYLEVRTSEDVINSIELLVRQPDLYRRMMVNYAERAEEINNGLVRRMWISIINDSIGPLFQSFLDCSEVKKEFIYFLKNPLDKLVRQYHSVAIRYGKKLLS